MVGRARVVREITRIYNLIFNFIHTTNFFSEGLV
jgi:hypothetical protein